MLADCLIARTDCVPGIVRAQASTNGNPAKPPVVLQDHDRHIFAIAASSCTTHIASSKCVVVKRGGYGAVSGELVATSVTGALQLNATIELAVGEVSSASLRNMLHAGLQIGFDRPNSNSLHCTWSGHSSTPATLRI